VEVALGDEPGSAADRITERHEDLYEERGGVGFAVRLDLCGEVASEAVERLPSGRLRPLLRTTETIKTTKVPTSVVYVVFVVPWLPVDGGFDDGVHHLVHGVTHRDPFRMGRSCRSRNRHVG
jgi:hypothetical protein